MAPIGGSIIGWICQNFSRRWGPGLGGMATIGAGIYARAPLAAPASGYPSKPKW